MRYILKRALAALRGFLAGFLGMPASRLGADPTQACDGACEAARMQRALEARSAGRGSCC